MSGVGILKRLNSGSSMAGESAMGGRQIVEEHGLKVLEEDKSEESPLLPVRLIYAQLMGHGKR
jgi:hypothetical protein